MGETSETPPPGADVLRRVSLTGTPFVLVTWYLGTRGNKDRLGYNFGEAGKAPIFVGEDFCCAPGFASDSDDSLRSLLGFLTLKPGDTDSEYFESYTDEQRAFASSHGEELSPWSWEDDTRLDGCDPGDGEPYPFTDLDGEDGDT